MLIPPLLPASLVEQVYLSIKEKRAINELLEMLGDRLLEEKIHILRFLLNKIAEDDEMKLLYTVWFTLVPQDSSFNTSINRKALDGIGKWWDAFDEVPGKNKKEYDDLEQVLDMLGTTHEGMEFFKWVALSPSVPVQNKIWDEYRRGAVICIGKYCMGKERELFLVRHLDDWNTIQIEAVQVLAAMKSRLLAQVAPWYIEHDDLLKPIIEEYL